MKKIVLLGDSIREGYDKYVKLAFDGVAQVYYPKENCRFTTYIIRNLLDWKKNLEWGDDVALVHWNVGLWDDIRMEDGEFLVDLADYKRNIDRICKMLISAFPQSKFIFATSTPVQEELFGAKKRYNKDTETYNAAACEIVKGYGMEINDLYSLMSKLPVSYHSDLTHYYTKEGTCAITDAVVDKIEKSLGIKGAALDYDALFGEQGAVLGI